MSNKDTYDYEESLLEEEDDTFVEETENETRTEEEEDTEDVEEEEEETDNFGNLLKATNKSRVPTTTRREFPTARGGFPTARGGFPTAQGGFPTARKETTPSLSKMIGDIQLTASKNFHSNRTDLNVSKPEESKLIAPISLQQPNTSVVSFQFSGSVDDIHKLLTTKADDNVPAGSMRIPFDPNQVGNILCLDKHFQTLKGDSKVDFTKVVFLKIKVVAGSHNLDSTVSIISKEKILNTTTIGTSLAPNSSKIMFSLPGQNSGSSTVYLLNPNYLNSEIATKYLGYPPDRSAGFTITDLGDHAHIPYKVNDQTNPLYEYLINDNKVIPTSSGPVQDVFGNTGVLVLVRDFEFHHDAYLAKLENTPVVNAEKALQFYATLCEGTKFESLKSTQTIHMAFTLVFTWVAAIIDNKEKTNTAKAPAPSREAISRAKTEEYTRSKIQQQQQKK